MKILLFLLLFSSMIYSCENSIVAKMLVTPFSREHVSYRIFPGLVTYDNNIDFKRSSSIAFEFDASNQNDIVVCSNFFTNVKPGIYRLLQDGQCSGTVVKFDKEVNIRIDTATTCDVFQINDRGGFEFIVTLSTN